MTAKLWVLWAFVAVPAYFEDKYFNITEAKSHMYIIGAIAAICCMALCVHYEDFEIGSYTDLGWICLVCVALISCGFSGDFMTSFMGSSGWRVGGLTLLLTALIYFLLRGVVEVSDRLGTIVLGFNVLVFLMAILHSAGIDVLGMHQMIKVEQFYSFLATIGNTNWYSGYLCILVPIVMIQFLEAKTPVRTWVLLAFMALAESNIILCGCDSIYIGIGLCMVFGIPYIVRRIERMRRTGLLILIYGTELLLIKNCGLFADRLAVVNGISGFMMKPVCAACIALVGLAIAVLLTVCRFENYEESRIPFVLTVVLEAVMFAVIGAFVYDMIAHFDDSFGTYRGRTWKYSIWLYGNYPLGSKIIGCGPEMQWIDYRSLSNMFGRTILVSHSEPIQVLLSMGALGFASWAMIVGGRIAAYFRCKLWNSSRIMWFLPLAAYLGQSLVNSCQLLNLGMMITVMAILDKELKEC